MILRSLIFVLGALSLSAEVYASSLQTVEGRLVWPSEITKAARIKLQLNLEDGKKIYTWPKSDGSFSFLNVPEGTWLMDVLATGVMYHQYRFDVRAGYPSGALVSVANEPEKLIPSPPIIKPFTLAEYFDKREPFNLIGFIKTPYGLMIAFAIFAMVVLPRLKIDPEELKEAKEALTGGGQNSDRPMRVRN